LAAEVYEWLREARRAALLVHGECIASQEL
jgi:hypothetical protein